MYQLTSLPACVTPPPLPSFYLPLPPSPPSGPRGDLYVFLTVKSDPSIERRGINLYSKLPIDFTEAILGTIKNVGGMTGGRGEGAMVITLKEATVVGLHILQIGGFIKLPASLHITSNEP